MKKVEELLQDELFIKTIFQNGFDFPYLQEVLHIEESDKAVAQQAAEILLASSNISCGLSEVEKKELHHSILSRISKLHFLFI